MPSQPSRPPLLRRKRFLSLERAGTLLLVALSAGVLAACSSAPRPVALPAPPAPEPPRVSNEEGAYLLAPLSGFTGALDPERQAELERGHRAVLKRGHLDEARRIVADLLASDPGLAPALVLAAEIDFEARNHRAVVERLQPVVAANPTYVAAQLLLGRSAELLGDIPLAYASFRAVAAKNAKAFERTGELHPRTLEILYARLEDALAHHELEAADRQLALLRVWGAQESRTLEGERALAVARGDQAAELAAVRTLAARSSGDRKLLERQATLELAVGDPRRGLEIVQGLADRYPRDPVVADELAAAKFRWRLTMLPKGLQDLAGKPELTKADFAALLYWLVPNVRYARVTSGRIATDVLDHPQQEAIVRIVNLGLLDLDSTLHRFYPGAPVRRGGALRALQRMLTQFGGGLACLGEGGREVCPTMAACRIVPSEDDCRASSPLAGTDAVEMIRRSLTLLGGS